MDLRTSSDEQQQLQQHFRYLRLHPYELYLAALPKDVDVTKTLLHLFFFPSSPKRFFSYTETRDEISLVLTKEEISLFPEGTLTYDLDQPWRAIQFEERLHFDSSGVVYSIAAPLAKEKIPIYYMSSYETAYILVAQSNIQLAVNTLKNRRFIFVNELESGEAPSDETTTDNSNNNNNNTEYYAQKKNHNSNNNRNFLFQPINIMSTSPTAAILYNNNNSSSSSNNSAANYRPQTSPGGSLATPSTTGSNVQMVIIKLPYKVFLGRLPKSYMKTHATTIMKLIFFANRSNRFFSILETQDEISLILDQTDLDVFSADGGGIDTCVLPWQVIQICEGSFGFNEYGIVSTFAQPLAAAKISIFNYSTYFTDYAMVQEPDFDRAMSVLSEALSVITEDHGYLDEE